MNAPELFALLGSAALGAVGARLLTPFFLARAPGSLHRTNVNGRSVPAVLGWPLLLAALAPLVLWLGLKWSSAQAIPPIVSSAGLVLCAFAAAGRWDDTKGHELPRGFRGHVGAARGGRLTGGMVKLLAGGVTGVLVGLALRDGTAALQTALIVPLTANLINLLDRAPGRAGKVSLIVGLPLLAFGHSGWALAAAGALGALSYLLVVDLAEVGMLGDMGANAIGGLLGLGLALSVPPVGRWVLIAVLVLLNGLSERVSFSGVIARTGWLQRLDMLGRRRDDEVAKGSDP